MMRLLTLSLLLLGLSGTCFAVDITPANPVPCNPPSLVRVVAAPNSDIWVLTIKDGQLVEIDVHFCPDPNSTTAIFTGAAKQTVAVLVKENNVRSQHIVVFADPDDPVPPPPPPPPPNDLAKQIAEMVARLVPAAHRDKAAPLAKVYRDVGDKIAVSIHTPNEIRIATRIASEKAVGSSLEAWIPFHEELAQRLLAWSEEQQRTKSDYKTTWKAIATGLEVAQRGRGF